MHRRGNIKIQAAGVLLLVEVLVSISPAWPQDPTIGSTSWQYVVEHGQQTVDDPQGDVTGPGGACPNPFNSGFDCGRTTIWLDGATDRLYVASVIYGNVGDADQDGGFSTKAAVCGGHPTCVGQEGDEFGNVFANSVERVRWYFDRDRDGTYDLLFTLMGAATQRADSVRVAIDNYPGHPSQVNVILGGRGVAWAGEPVHRNSDVVCVRERTGRIMVCIPEWHRYFTEDAEPTGKLVEGISPTSIDWRVLFENETDLYNADWVSGFVDIEVAGALETLEASPAAIRIETPMPNPFRNSVRLAYVLDGGASQTAMIRVLDVAGRSLRSFPLVDSAPGHHEIVWDGTDYHGIPAANGIYFFRLISGPRTATARAVLLR